jgi:glycosyltransferase involved in cell wall biosynthesis
MNILVLNWRDKFHPEAGGAEVHLHEIFSRLVSNGHTVCLLTTRYRGATREDDIDGVKVFRLGRTYTFNWEAPLLIRRLLKRMSFDCIIDDVNKIPFFTPRWFPRIPTGAFFHHLFGTTVFELTAWPLAAYVLLLERLSAWGYRGRPCCTVSSSTAEELVELGLDRHKIAIIENSVDTALFTPADPVDKDPNLLLYFGRLKKYKNLDILLDAVSALTERGRTIRLAIGGDGDDRSRLREKAAQLGIEDRVAFHGFVDESEKISLYRKASIYINPSLKEGWGITNIEANACGTAVIANNAPGLRDSVRDGETGLLYEENNRDDLVRCIEQLLDNDSLRHRFERAGRAWAQTFSWDSSAKKVAKWLQTVVQHRS